MRRPNGGKKVKMARMRNEANRQVTFSKRRTGLLKKATEICTLCGATLAIVIFNSNNKFYSCGHPDVESIVDKFLGENPPPEANAPIVVPHHNPNVDVTNRQLNRLESSMRRQKERREALQALRTKPPIEQLSLFELKQLSEALEAAEEEVERVANQQMECLIEFPYETLGNAFAPLRDVESSSSGSDEGPSASHGE